MRMKQAKEDDLHPSSRRGYDQPLLVQKTCDALVLDARLRQSLVSVRSLGSRNLRVAAIETFDGVPAFSSKWCQQKDVLQAGEGTLSYFAYL